MSAAEKFVLIGGMPRSGTTLVETVIGSHSEIAIPPGDFPFAEQCDRGMSVDRIFTVLGSRETWNLWHEKNFESLLDKSHEHAFRQSLIDYCVALGKRIPGAKAPYNEFFFETYQSWLRDYDLKFVHVVRNPLDVLASLKHSHIHKNLHAFNDLLEIQARNWSRSTALGLARRQQYPGNYFLFEYEAFVETPEASVAELCDFIGIAPEPERMLNRVDYGYHDTNTSFPDIARQSGGQTDYVYRASSRKSFLDRAEVDLVAAVCGEVAHAIGYMDEDFKPRRPDYPGNVKPSVKAARRTRRLLRRFGL